MISGVASPGWKPAGLHPGAAVGVDGTVAWGCVGRNPWGCHQEVSGVTEECSGHLASAKHTHTKTRSDTQWRSPCEVMLSLHQRLQEIPPLWLKILSSCSDIPCFNRFVYIKLNSNFQAEKIWKAGPRLQRREQLIPRTYDWVCVVDAAVFTRAHTLVLTLHTQQQVS